MPPPTDTSLAKISVEEFERLPEPEQGGGYELDEGELAYVCPNNLVQAKIIQRIYMPLEKWAETNHRGLVAPDTWIRIGPDTVRAPDVSFIPRERLVSIDPKHPLTAVPILAVEVLSPFNTAREISRKIQQYRDAGVELIWVVDPEKCEVDVYSSAPLKTVRKGDSLKNDKILPGFSLPLDSLFEPVL